jgi:hypothetical protein
MLLRYIFGPRQWHQRLKSTNIIPSTPGVTHNNQPEKQGRKTYTCTQSVTYGGGGHVIEFKKEERYTKNNLHGEGADHVLLRIKSEMVKGHTITNRGGKRRYCKRLRLLTEMDNETVAEMDKKELGQATTHQGGKEGHYVLLCTAKKAYTWRVCNI